MPHSVQLHPEIIPVAITARRLDSYKSVFSASSEHELVACYLWNLHVCAALYPLLNSAEVTKSEPLLRSSFTHRPTADI